jgi:subtilisin family serine protease
VRHHRFAHIIFSIALGCSTAVVAGNTRTGQGPLEAIDIARAGDVTRGSGATVGIVDIGFDFFHPALKDALEPGYFAPGVFHTPAPALTGHGTAVASVIGARHSSGGGFIGLAPEARMIAASQGMPDHLLMRLAAKARKQGSTDVQALQNTMLEQREAVQAFTARWVQHIAASTADGIRDLVDRGVRVIAIASYLPSEALARSPEAASRVHGAFRYARQRDVLIVIGAGNSDTRVAAYPGEPDSVIVVGAADATGGRWSVEARVGERIVRQGSNFGPRLTVLAPAWDVKVAAPHDPGFYRLSDSPVGPVDEPFVGAYRTEASGATSLATAVVAGLAVLVRAAAPELTTAQVIDVIARSATDVGDPGRDDFSGYGVVDFERALDEAIRRKPR